MNVHIFGNSGNSRYLFVLVAAIALLTASFYMSNVAFARPTAATASPGTDDFGPPTGTAGSDPARGGVITQLTLNATVQTNNWQGYFGYVGSYIVLADSGNNWMYSWNVSNPQGSVLAARSASINVTGLAVQQTCTVEDSVIPDAVSDQVSDAFTNTTHTNITIGNVSISSQVDTGYTCSVDLFVNNISNTSWEENLLTDGNGNYIYQTFINYYDNEIFNDGNYNFQMMVPEDEAGAAGTTNYYFWLELQ